MKKLHSVFRNVFMLVLFIAQCGSGEEAAAGAAAAGEEVTVPWFASNLPIIVALIIIIICFVIISKKSRKMNHERDDNEHSVEYPVYEKKNMTATEELEHLKNIDNEDK